MLKQAEQTEIEQDSIYEERIVAFFDILGFRNIIKGTENNQELGRRVLQVLNYVGKIKDENRNGLHPECDVVGRQVTVFSDSIIISYPTYSPSSLFYIIYDAVNLQMNMFNNGFLIRGGISLGKMYHQRDVAFGPAFVSAYDLETNCAFYPRVVIAKETVDLGLTKNPHNLPEDERRSVNQLLRKDFDGFYYVDFLNQRAETNDDQEYADLLTKVREMIITGLTLNNARLTQKYEWLKNKYNNAVILQKLEDIVAII